MKKVFADLFGTLSGPILALALITVLLRGPSVLAQPTQPPQPAAPTLQDVVTTRIATELGRLRIDNATLTVSVEELQRLLAQAQARVKELEAKCPAQ